MGRLRLENRVNMLKHELQKQFRIKARDARKKQALDMLHREQAETKDLLKKMKKQKQQEEEQRRRECQNRKSAANARINYRKQQTLEYKKTMAHNAKLEAKIREELLRTE